MKRLFLMAVLLLMPHMHYAMEGNQELTKETAEKLWWEVGPAQDQGTVDYTLYKKSIIDAIPFVSEVQHHYHNPLVHAVCEGDYEFTKLLLEKGASPIFRGMNKMDAFDALRFRNSPVFSKPDALKKIEELLIGALKPGEQHTPYPLAGINAVYVTDRELVEMKQ